MHELPNRLLSTCIVLLVLTHLSITRAQTPDRPAAEAAASRVSERMRALQLEADRLAGQEKTLLSDLRRLEIDREIKVEQEKEIRDQAAAAEADLSAASARIAALEMEDNAMRPQLRDRMVEMYKLGQGRYARLLMGAADLARVGEAARTIAALAEMDRKRIAAHQQTLTDLRASRTVLEQRSRQLETLRVDAERARKAVEQAAIARTAAIQSIDRQRDLNAQLTGELQSAQQRLQVTLGSLGATAAAPAAPGPGAPPPADLPVKPFRGDLPWPAEGALRRRFTRPGAGATAVASGIEIAATEGSPVLAVHDGLVAFADVFTGFGNLVIIDHGAQTFSLYGNLAAVSVQKGARIAAGQAVGTVGLSPAGPAGLYFELRVDGQPVDPLQWLKKR